MMNKEMTLMKEMKNICIKKLKETHLTGKNV